MATASRRAPATKGSPGKGSMTSVQQLEMKRKILQSVQRLSDRDCAETAVLELREAAQHLDREQFALMLHTLTEGLGNPHYAKMAFTRRLIIQIVGELGAEHMERLTRRSCSRLCATIFQHVDDADGNVREACADAFALLAQSYAAILPRSSSANGRANSPQGGSRISLFLQCVFDSMSAKAQGKMAQCGAALCLARMIARVGAAHVTPALPRLCQRIEQHLNSKSCAARTELLQALANIAEVSREDLFPHAPFTAVLKCLHSSSFDTRVAAADVLGTCGLRLGASMVGLAPMIVQELEGKRFDTVKPVRDAVLEAIDAFAPLMPPTDEGAREADAPGAESGMTSVTLPTTSEDSPGYSSRARQHLTFSPASALTTASGNSDDTDDDDLDTSRGAQVEGEIKGWAAAQQEERTGKQSSKRNRSKRRVPLFAQQPNLNFFAQQPDPETLLEQAQRKHEESKAAATAVSTASVAPGSPVADTFVEHQPGSIAHAETFTAASRVATHGGTRADEVQLGLQRDTSASAASDDEFSDKAAESAARGRYASAYHQVSGSNGPLQSGDNYSSMGETISAAVEPREISSRLDSRGESGTERWGAKSSPKIAWRASDPAADPRSPVPTDDRDSGAGGIFDDSFDANCAADAGLNSTADAAAQRGDTGDSTSSRDAMSTTSRQQTISVCKPSSYFETELQSDSPLPLRIPGQDRGQVTRVEFNEIAVQLRQISEQQQQLVKLIESSYGALDDRMGAVEASVQTINSHLGL